jgi:hypothetical protein
MGYQGNPSNNSVVVHPTELQQVSNGRCITRGCRLSHIIPSEPELKVHLPKEYGCTLHHPVALVNSSTWSTIWSRYGSFVLIPPMRLGRLLHKLQALGRLGGGGRGAGGGGAAPSGRPMRVSRVAIWAGWSAAGMPRM